MLLAQRHQYGAGQGGEIDHEFGLVLVLHIPQHVGQHEPALGIGVEDGDGLARHRGDDVARPLRLAVRHVLGKADGAHRVDPGLAPGQRHHQARHAGGTPHVALHVFHAGGGLDRDAAGIESDALADEGQRLFARLAALPFHDGDARLVLRAHRHAKQRSHAELLHLRRRQDGNLEAELRQRPHALGEGHRVQHVGRLVDEIAGQMHAARHCLQSLEALLGATGFGSQDGDVFQRLVFRFLRFVVVETIDPKHGARAQQGRRRVRGDIGNFHIRRQTSGFHLQSLQYAGDGAAQHFDIERLQRLRKPDAEQHDAGKAAARRHQIERRIAAASEGSRLHGPGDMPRGPCVGGGGKTRKRLALAQQQNEHTGFRQGGSRKTDFHGRPSDVGNSLSGFCRLRKSCGRRNRRLAEEMVMKIPETEVGRRQDQFSRRPVRKGFQAARRL